MANSSQPLIFVWTNKREKYKKLALISLLSCQYHSAHQRTAEQQHRQMCIYTASCCVLHDDH
jgi:hypothetical protein